MTKAFRQSRRAAMLTIACLVGLVQVAAAQPGPLEGVAIAARSDKRVYLLGEPVNLDVRITNGSSRAADIPAAADVWTGHVEVFVAPPGGDYVQYIGPGWGLRDAIGGETGSLERGQSRSTQAAILYNHGLKTEHLSPAARAGVRDRLLHSGFAFQSPGVYRIKVVVHGNGFTDSVESDAVEIAMIEPEGVDRIVWRALKSAPEVAYFLHTGGPKGHPQERASQATVDMLRRLAEEYPSTRYAERIHDRLAAHARAAERLRDRGLVTP